MSTRLRSHGLLFVAALIFLATFAAPAGATPVANKAKQQVLEDLQVAYNGESSAHAKYLAYAKKADEEGYAGVASLFRATARSEEIHAASHAEVIRKLGAEPKADIKDAEVKSTRENLTDALNGENYERLEMYPKFIAAARQARMADAVRTFTRAKNTEAEHAKLYEEALGKLDSWKSARTFYVCPTCGYTVPKLTFQECPVCSTNKKEFETIK